MNLGLIMYIASTGWLGGRLLVVLLETTGHFGYTVRHIRTLKKFRSGKPGRNSKPGFSTTRDKRFSTSKEFSKKASAYLSLNEADIIVPAIYIRPNQTLLGLLQEFDSLRHNNALMLGAVPVPPYAIKRTKPLKKAQAAYYADDLSIEAKPLQSYWQLALHNFNDQSKRIENVSVTKRIRKNVINFVLLLEPFMVGYFIYLALAHDIKEPLALAVGMAVFSLIFYVWSDRQRNLMQKTRLIFLAPMTAWLMYLLSITRIFALTKVIAAKARKDWSNWSPSYLSS